MKSSLCECNCQSHLINKDDFIVLAGFFKTFCYKAFFHLEKIFQKKNALFTDTMDEADESLIHITRYLFGLGRRIIKKNVRYLRGKQYSQDDQIIFMANDKI